MPVGKYRSGYRFIRGISGLSVPASVSSGAAAGLASVPWVAQWKFNNDGNDSIGANHLTGVNTPTFTTGKLGGATGATQLTAANLEYWNIADNEALSTGDVDFSVLLWLYADSLTAVNIIAAKGTANAVANDEWALFWSNTDARFKFSVFDGAGNFGSVLANTLGVPSLATWYCIIAWHDAVANTVNIQANDGAVDSVAYSFGSNNGNKAFGVGWDASYQYFDGRIDNLCIAKSAAGGGGVLSASQRSAFYAAGVGTENLT